MAEVILQESAKEGEYSVISDNKLKCKHMPYEKAKAFAETLAGKDKVIDKTKKKKKAEKS